MPLCEGPLECYWWRMKSEILPWEASIVRGWILRDRPPWLLWNKIDKSANVIWEEAPVGRLSMTTTRHHSIFFTKNSESYTIKYLQWIRCKTYQYPWHHNTDIWFAVPVCMVATGLQALCVATFAGLATRVLKILYIAILVTRPDIWAQVGHYTWQLARHYALHLLI